MRADAPDFVLFLGDYIYEYPNAVGAVRSPGGGWTVTLDDYRRLDRAMVKAAWTGAGEGDIVALVVDAARCAPTSTTGLLQLALLALGPLIGLYSLVRILRRGDEAAPY